MIESVKVSVELLDHKFLIKIINFLRIRYEQVLSNLILNSAKSFAAEQVKVYSDNLNLKVTPFEIHDYFRLIYYVILCVTLKRLVVKDYYFDLYVYIASLTISQPAVTCSKLTIETLERFEHISYLVLVFLLLTLSR